jgi:Ni,Fe-hydrogenase I cytochrome b subunit
MTQVNFRANTVWDGPTRWFHWINFVCVVALAVLGTAILYSKELGVTDDGKILLKTTIFKRTASSIHLLQVGQEASALNLGAGSHA